jgi:hypothetical protein
LARLDALKRAGGFEVKLSSVQEGGQPPGRETPTVGQAVELHLLGDFFEPSIPLLVRVSARRGKSLSEKQGLSLSLLPRDDGSKD